MSWTINLEDIRTFTDINVNKEIKNNQKQCKNNLVLVLSKNRLRT